MMMMMMVAVTNAAVPATSECSTLRPPAPKNGSRTQKWVLHPKMGAAPKNGAEKVDFRGFFPHEHQDAYKKAATGCFAGPRTHTHTHTTQAAARSPPAGTIKGRRVVAWAQDTTQDHVMMNSSSSVTTDTGGDKDNRPTTPQPEAGGNNDGGTTTPQPEAGGGEGTRKRERPREAPIHDVKRLARGAMRPVLDARGVMRPVLDAPSRYTWHGGAFPGESGYDRESTQALGSLKNILLRVLDASSLGKVFTDAEVQATFYCTVMLLTRLFPPNKGSVKLVWDHPTLPMLETLLKEWILRHEEHRKNRQPVEASLEVLLDEVVDHATDFKRRLAKCVFPKCAGDAIQALVTVITKIAASSKAAADDDGASVYDDEKRVEESREAVRGVLETVGEGDIHMLVDATLDAMRCTERTQLLTPFSASDDARVVPAYYGLTVEGVSPLSHEEIELFDALTGIDITKAGVSVQEMYTASDDHRAAQVNMALKINFLPNDEGAVALADKAAEHHDLCAAERKKLWNKCGPPFWTPNNGGA